MEKRRFGNTGLETSLLGFGGFHLCEIPFAIADNLLNTYLDAGGNYIETAPSYGNGESEIKIGRAVSRRRSEYILVTKAHDRDYATCKKTFEQSLLNLQTDYLDVVLLHAVDTFDTLDLIFSENGAMKAIEEAKAVGQIKHIGISMHGQPDVLIEALKRYPFEAVMTTINYFDHCNFPTIQNTLLPLAREKDAAVILMKALGDGYLYKNAKNAFRYALSQPVSVIVAGINSLDMLDMDLEIFEENDPMTIDEIVDLMQSAPELGNYVCRQCGACNMCPEGIDIPQVFMIEAMFDRQMGDGDVADAGLYALKERLKHWFGTTKRSVNEYAALKKTGKNCTACGNCLPLCPYSIDIIAKLNNVDYKLDPEYGKIFE